MSRSGSRRTSQPRKRGKKVPFKNYLLIKSGGLDAKGRECSARVSAKLLLDARVWPLWEFTRNRKVIAPGDRVAIYLAGVSEVIATAQVQTVGRWSVAHAKAYPLMLDGTPTAVLLLDDVAWLPEPVKVKARLSSLSFIPPDAPKWGVAFMGGTRAVNDVDFEILTSPAALKMA